MEFLGTINTVWAFSFALIYLAVETVKQVSKTRKEKKSEFATLTAFNALSEKLDNHILSDIQKQAEVSLHFEGAQILHLINFSPRQEKRIDKAFEAYSAKGANGVVAEAYYEYKQRRQNSLANLKFRTKNKEQGTKTEN